jgi:hypothetical protein
MPIEFESFPEHDLGVLRHVGIVADDEFLRFYSRLYDKREKRHTAGLLVDLRDADSTPRSPDALRSLSRIIQDCLQAVQHAPKVAVVAPRDLSYGLARMYDMYSEGIPWQFVVFRDVEAALAWLRIPDDMVKRLTRCDPLEPP